MLQKKLRNEFFWDGYIFFPGFKLLGDKEVNESFNTIKSLSIDSNAKSDVYYSSQNKTSLKQIATPF